ncbi:hypothetical protein B0H14DRAFT_1622297 [Mycena olivaceomarginata]|nr:hypothetical protein B0H14DRAFT_1622297 [Mycena olivaceomarginata]
MKIICALLCSWRLAYKLTTRKIGSDTARRSTDWMTRTRPLSQAPNKAQARNSSPDRDETTMNAIRLLCGLLLHDRRRWQKPPIFSTTSGTSILQVSLMKGLETRYHGRCRTAGNR